MTLFDISLDFKIVGRAQVSRKGLYYQFVCTCTPPDNRIYKVWVSNGATEIDLGICVPAGDAYMLTKHLPVKLLPGENFTFSLHPKDVKRGVDAADEPPAEPLEQLEYAKLNIVNGQETITIEQFPDRPGSDLNPESPRILGLP